MNFKIVASLAIGVEILLAAFALANISEAVLKHEVYFWEAVLNSPTELLSILIPTAATIAIAIGIIGFGLLKTPARKFF